MIAFLDPETKRSIVLQFAEQIELLVPQITNAIASGDNSDAVRLAHQLRGSCLSMGADLLAEITRQTEERHRRTPAPPATSDKIQELEQAARKTLAALRSASATPDELP